MADSASSPIEGTTFDITIDETSPTITYSQSADGNSNSTTGGWSQCFSQSGDSECGGQETMNGTTLHTTATDDASFTVGWFGE